MSRRRLLFLAVTVAVVTNGVGYALFRTPRPAPSRAKAEAKPRENETIARRGQEEREAGYRALLEGDYDKALIHLTEARSNVADPASVDELLRITAQLRSKAAVPSGPADPAPSVESRTAPEAKPETKPEVHPSASSNVSKAKPPPRRTPASPRPEGPGAGPRTEETGLLLVTSTPRGLLVHVDGVAADLTPMRSVVPAGLHRVAMFDGERKLFETQVEVTESRPTTVMRDLSQELAPPARPSSSPPPPSAPSSASPSASAPTEEEPPAAPSAPAPSSAAREAGSTSAGPLARGSLEITSPGLYAEIWVDGRPRGFPPATVSDLPAGPARVEIRINGVVKRARTVEVEAGRTISVRVTK